MPARKKQPTKRPARKTSRTKKPLSKKVATKKATSKKATAKKNLLRTVASKTIGVARSVRKKVPRAPHPPPHPGPGPILPPHVVFPLPDLVVNYGTPVHLMANIVAYVLLPPNGAFESMLVYDGNSGGFQFNNDPLAPAPRMDVHYQDSQGKELGVGHHAIWRVPCGATNLRVSDRVSLTTTAADLGSFASASGDFSFALTLC